MRKANVLFSQSNNFRTGMILFSYKTQKKKKTQDLNIIYKIIQKASLSSNNMRNNI